MPAVFPRSDPVVKAKTPSCHDCWCILVFGLVLAGMVCLTLWATIKEGAHIQRLIHPVDYAGRMCGISPGVQDKPFIYVCGKASAGFEGDYPSQLDLHSKTCVAACPSLGGDVACIGRPLVTPKALDCQDNGCVVNGIQVRKTVTWQISQAVTYQKAYPTDEFRGMICAPKWEAPNDLRSQVLFGDASPLSSAGEAFGSLETAWPVLLAVFGIATLLSILVLLCMTCYAGPVLFMAILLADIMVFILGIFFAIGLFFDPYNTAGWYQSWNPIDRTVYGEWARVLTFFTGLFFLVVGVLLTHTLLHASERLDEPIGMIHASMEFIFDPGPSHSSIPFLILVPFGNSLLTLALLAASIYCLMLVLTAGPVDGKGIVIDGEHYTSLYKGVQKPWNGLGWDIAMVVFVAGIIWILELMIGVGQYVISHCVCEWFFQPIDEIAPLEMKKQKEELASTNPEVKRTSLDKVHIVGGAAAGVHKEGYIEHDQETGQKKMVVYLRDKGPNDKPNVPTIIESKKHQIGWVCTGFCHAMTYKLGTLLYFSWYVFFTRPLRVTAEVLRFMATDPTIKLKREQFDEETDEQGWWKVIANGSSLFCTYVTHEYGGVWTLPVRTGPCVWLCLVARWCTVAKRKT
ncbi:unnamed protein product [Durusdinium trenchii]|uniref:Choline transporter-like protein n=1 Tax=Durusdinium trenchii TaxID=1381693 RepID=A0ABP0NQU4_9DINO